MKLSNVIYGLALFLSAFIYAADRPNIVWITAEDMSPVLGCYGDKDAISPNIDKLSGRSVLYSNAFATAPVCSPSRSCLINGLPATSQGTQNMRSAFPIPTYMKGFPALLKEKGYFTSNNVKTDYNSANWDKIIKASWSSQGSKAHWRQRKGDQAFFSIFNLMTSHQSRAMVWPYEKFQLAVQSKLTASEIHDPAKITLPPYYPDTPTVRKTQARFYDCVTAMDKEVGALIQQLKEDGLDDDTIVFFYSDHGSGMPRHKRALMDSGMKVAMMVHVPKKWQHLVKAEQGSKSNRLINFADFGPTVLSILNLDIPEYMEGKPFLGKKEAAAHKYVLGHRDRVDEVIDMARSVRSQDFLYIRTFMPHMSYNQPTAWPDLGEIRHEFYKAATGKLSGPQAHFMGPTRMIEELYDCKKDPMNLNNLVLSKDHQNKLNELRSVLRKRIIANKDLGFLPEAMQWELSKGSTPYDMARKNYNIGAIFEAANQVGSANEKQYLQNMKSKDAAIRFWGVMGLSASSNISSDARIALNKTLSDDYVNVRIQAADALLRNGVSEKALSTLGKALTEDNMAAVMHAARTIEMLGEKAISLLGAMQECDKKMKVIRPPGTSPVVVQTGRVDMAMFVGFSTEAFVKRFKK